MVYRHHASILHRCEDMAPQRQWGHKLDLLGSREVIALDRRKCTELLFVWCMHSNVMKA